MNTRERFHATMNFEPLDRPLYWEFGYWVPAIRRWYNEGLPCKNGVPDDVGDEATLSGELAGIDWRNPYTEYDVHDELGFDEHVYRIPVNNVFSPQFESKILEDHGEWYTAQDVDGIISRVSRINGSRLFLEFPVKTRADYERIREERLQPNLDDRLTEDWDELRPKLEQRTFPLMYGGMVGFLNTPRRYMGFERLMYAFYDDPDLVKEIIEDSADLMISLYDPLLSEVGGDYGVISEDMCYKGGCFVSPDMFREFMLPAYQRMTDFYRSHGVNTILVDCDGDVTGLIPLLIEGGVTGLYPFEVTNRCDVVAARQAFPRFQIFGGLDKKCIAAGPEAIEAELGRKVPTVFKTGGFVPFTDHTVPPDVSWDNFRYYRERLAELAVGG